MQLVRHSFACAQSPDLVAGRYEVIYRILQHGTSDWSEPGCLDLGRVTSAYLYFDIDAPIGAQVELMLFAVDDDDNDSMPVRYAWTVTGRKVIRMPGQTPQSLRMMSAGPAANPPVQLTIAGKPIDSGPRLVHT